MVTPMWSRSPPGSWVDRLAAGGQPEPFELTVAGDRGGPGLWVAGAGGLVLTWVLAPADRAASRPPRGPPRSHQQLPRCPTVRLALPHVRGAWLVRCVRVAGACRGEVLPLAVW